MRILVADDAEIIRRGVRGLLSGEADWEICGEASDGPEAFQKARELRPDVVLLDINMPSESGLKTARDIRRDLPEVKIVVMSAHDPEQFMPSVLAAGGNRCVDKSRLATDLVPAIRELM